MNAQTTILAATAPLAIGLAVLNNYDRLMYIIEAKQEQAGLSLLIGGPAPMAAINWSFTAIDGEGRKSCFDEHTGKRYAAKAAHLPPCDDLDNLRARYEAAAARQKLAGQELQKLQEANREANQEELAAKVPAWAAAVIVAEYMRDDSDTMTDYFHEVDESAIVLAYSRHERDLFAEMRKAAALSPETAFLSDAPENHENRCKYSMGGGYYLQAPGRGGWRVKKYRVAHFTSSPPSRYRLQFVEPESAPAVAGVALESCAGRFSIEEHTHTKKGFQMFICTMSERVERAEYDQLLSDARALGGWYSRAWAGAPAGFAFKQREAAEQFAGIGQAEIAPAVAGVGPESRKAAPAVRPVVNLADKLRTLADGLQSAIDDKFRDRTENTPKQRRQAAESRIDGWHYQRAQKIARALADCHDAGTVPPCLAKVSTKAALLDLALEHIERGNCGYYDAGMMTGKPYPWRDAAKLEAGAAAWALLVEDPAAREAEALRQKVAGLKDSKIAGYFPTPSELVSQMIERARIKEGDSVLEPSAGSGAIADALRDAGAVVCCFEKHSTLCDVLRSKGHDVEQCDFLDIEPLSKADAVLMNPPFEKAQDCEHVRHAWQFVKAGGCLVAIMGAGVKFRQDRAYREMREFIEEHGGEIVDIPAGAFKESGTGVASVMVELWKEG